MSKTERSWENLVELRDVSDLQTGEISAFDIETDSGELISLAIICMPEEENGYLAFENICTHDDGYLDDGEVDIKECSITCSRHGARFNLRTGKVISMPAPSDIRTFPLRIENEYLQILI